LKIYLFHNYEDIHTYRKYRVVLGRNWKILQESKVCTRKANFTRIANKYHCDYIKIHWL